MKQLADNKNIIFTIGHGNRKIEDLISLLQKNSIELVIDVRSIPYSRYHPQFRQPNLKASLECVEIEYLWLGKELGGRPADPVLYLNGNADYRAMKETEEFKAGIEQVLELLRQGIKVTLICSESDQNKCHRKHLIANELIKIGVSVTHIDKCGNLKRDNMLDHDLFST